MSEKSGTYSSTGGGGGGGGGYRNNNWNKNKSGWDNKNKVNKKGKNNNKGGKGPDDKKYHKQTEQKPVPKREVVLRPDLITLKVISDSELGNSTNFQSVVFQDYSSKSWVQCPPGEQRAAFNNHSMFYLVAKGTSKEDLEQNNEVGREKLTLDGKYCLFFSTTLLFTCAAQVVAVVLEVVY